ncbi:MAG: hypothetical protein MH137_13090 [Flavobacteriales bacterium]|nr:hypothetical protein [Flavobacteriales bacterium]
MSKWSFKTQKTAFCSISGNTENPKSIWFVLHGYGQLGEYFIRHFEAVKDNETLIVAPEAPSRFYVDAGYERVGASWMTKLNREEDIEDIHQYLNAVWQHVIETVKPAENCTFHFLGFSQGVPVLCRWLQTQNIPVHKLILWAGAFPHDMSKNELLTLFKRGKTYAVYGTRDPFLNESRAQLIQEIPAEFEQSIALFTFDGAHVMDSETLQKIHAD